MKKQLTNTTTNSLRERAKEKGHTALTETLDQVSGCFT